MSQNEAPKSPVNDKWREIAKQADATAEAATEAVADDEHLLMDESTTKALSDKVNLLEKQLDFFKDQVARTQAEMANAQRRMDQEISKARKFGVEKMVSELIPVVESLSRALESPSVGVDDPMRQGMELTLGMLTNLLEKNGITTIDPKVGDLFDPARHEAMSMRQDPEVTSNTVSQVLQRGYALHGRVVRAAMVIVAT